MKSLLNSFYLTLHDRMVSPLFGSFVFAWLCWNHSYVLILLSSLPVDQRLALARSEVFPDHCAIFLRGFLYPLASAGIFILCYPFPAKWVYSYWHKRQQELKAVRDTIEGATLLTKEESQSLTARLYQARAERDKERTELMQDLERIRSENERLSKRPADDTYKPITEWFENSWAERHAENEQLFDAASREAKDPEGLRVFMEKLFGDMVRGRVLGNIKSVARDCTPSAVGAEGRFIYHPTILPGTKLDPLGPLQRILKDQRGSFLWANSSASEQFQEFITLEKSRLMFGQFYRFTWVEFRDVLDGSAYIVFEDHINVLDKIPALQYGPQGPGQTTDAKVPSTTESDFQMVIRYLNTRMEGALSSELRQAFPQKSEGLLRELIDEAFQRNLVTREAVDSRGGEYRYRLTTSGKNLAESLTKPK
jgi:hypothetical protein